MSAIPDWTPTPPEEATPAYVIAGGASASGAPWRLELRPSATNVQLSLPGFEPGAGDFELTDEPIVCCCGHVEGFSVATFGAIARSVTSVGFQPADGGGLIPGRILPLPPSMPFDFDLFVIGGTEGLAGRVVASGPARSGSSSPPAPPVAAPRSDETILSGMYGDQSWLVTLTGAFADGTACIRVTIDQPYPPNCPARVETTLAGDQPSSDSWSTDTLHLQVSSVVPEVVEVRFTSDDDVLVPWEFHCAMGPLGWTDPDRKVCAIALPPNGSGTLAFLDAQGRVLFETGTGWGVSRPEVAMPAPIEPVHGGTYWAVYPWLGVEGGPESNAVVGQLAEDFGIQATQGDVACDEGAADVVGPGITWRVGVYFDTEAKARACAATYRDRDRGSDPVIAHVTTFCLD
jgi:hypothetical protein